MLHRIPKEGPRLFWVGQGKPCADTRHAGNSDRTTGVIHHSCADIVLPPVFYKNRPESPVGATYCECVECRGGGGLYHFSKNEDGGSICIYCSGGNCPVVGAFSI